MSLAALGARGWRAEIADDPEDGEPAEVVVYCAECWRRERVVVVYRSDA